MNGQLELVYWGGQGEIVPLTSQGVLLNDISKGFA
jgi:hypothetical protein